MLDRPKPLAIVRGFALPAAAAALASGAILWPSRAWIGKTIALLAAGALVVLTEVPRSSVRGQPLRGSSAAIGVVAMTLTVLALAAIAIAAGAPSVRLLPAALVLVGWQVVARLADGGLVIRRAAIEGVLALAAVLVVVGAEELHRLEIRVGHPVEAPEPVAEIPGPAAPAADGGAPQPYGEPEPNLPAVFGGTPGAAPTAPSGSCPEELTEENTALLWMRLQDRRGEGVSLRDTEEPAEGAPRRPSGPAKAASVVPRRLHCACAPQRDKADVFLAYCGRTRELCQAEAGSRAQAGSCTVTALGIGRRVDCGLELRGVSVTSDATSLSVSVRSVIAANKLVPTWATLDAQALARGRLVPIAVQRLRWARSSTAPVDWRATNFPGAARAVAALGRALSRTGMHCQQGTCEAGEGSVSIDWCAGTNEVHPPRATSGEGAATKERAEPTKTRAAPERGRGSDQ